MDGPSCAGPQPFGDDAFSSFYDAVCAEVRTLGVEQYRAEFDALDSDTDRVAAILRLKNAGKLRLPAAGRTGKSEPQARRFLEMAMNCTEPRRKLVLCNTALLHCPREPDVGGSFSELHLAILLNRLWTVFELGCFASGLAEAERLLDAPALAAAPVETRVQLLVERARFEAALARGGAAEASVRQALLIVRQLQRQQQAMYARELGTIRKRLSDAEPAQPDASAGGPPPPPRLFGGEHERLRRVSAAVELAESERRGRHLVATTDIPPGSVVIVDEPFAWSLHPPRWTTHCQNCCRPADCPLPCTDCASVLFCSEACRSEALRLFHATECPVLDLLIDPNLGRMALLVFRLLVRAGPAVLQEEPAEPAEPAGEHDSLLYPAVHSQVTNNADRPMGDVIKRCAVALYLTACLERAGAVPESSRTRVAGLALRHLQSCSCNAYEITELRLDGGGARLAEFEELGGAVYAAVSLANHSCFPNVVRSSRGRGVSVATTRPLRAGDELLDNYGFQFHEEEETARYAALRRQYQFGCECTACEQGWPLYTELEEGAPPPAEQRAAVELLVLGRYAEAAERLAPVVAADGAGERETPPDKQTVQRQSLFIRCLQSTGNVSGE